MKKLLIMIIPVISGCTKPETQPASTINSQAEIKPIQEFQTVAEYNKQFIHPEIERLQKTTNKDKKCIYFIKQFNENSIPTSEDKISYKCSEEFKENSIIHQNMNFNKINRQTHKLSNGIPTFDN